MKAIILAAGEGQRMRPLTLTTPKPLLKIKGKPIIEYLFEALPPEISEVIIVVKYLADQIKNYLGREFCGRKIIFVEGSDKGTAYSFLAARACIEADEEFLFIYGDELVNPADVNNCLQKGLSVLIFESQNPQANGIVSLRVDGAVEEIVEKPEQPKTNLAVDGIMVLNSSIFDYEPLANKKGEYYLTSLVNRFIKDHNVWPVRAVNFIGDITTPEDLERVAKLM